MNQDPAPDPKAQAANLTAIAQELKEAKAALSEAEAKLGEMTTLAQRTAADLQNFKRRSEEERGQIKIYANQQLLEGIFPVIDNFKRAFDHIPEALKENEWVKGVYAIERQFLDTLKALGLEEIPCEIGSLFDPHKHEVVMQDAGTKDAILGCLERGYTWSGIVIRPAKVKVGSGEQSTETEGSPEK